ncbi:MAG: phosphomannomutase/phosphoglucomutase, partial [Spirochaetales bacterium]|nr:phosphomannomutase/phosphoglucomutase [Spirochaetales bacterium]
FIDSVVTWSNSGEVNFKLEEKDEAMQELYRRYAKEQSPTEVMDFDGYRIEFPTWWFNVRKSNTEPYLRLVVEAKDDIELAQKLEELSAVIRSFK